LSFLILGVDNLAYLYPDRSRTVINDFPMINDFFHRGIMILRFLKSIDTRKQVTRMVEVKEYGD